MRNASHHNQSVSKLNLSEIQKKANEEKKKLKEHQDQLISEWGFENETTKKMFEARLKQRAGKKKKTLTAEEKLQRFLQIKNQK